MHCTMCPTVLTGRQKRYCSPLCAQRGYAAARAADGRRARYEQRPEVRRKISLAAARRRAGYTQTFTCQRCGTEHTNRRGEQARFCSSSCSRPVVVRPREVKHRAPRPDLIRECVWCATSFTSTCPTSAYCTPRCRTKVKELRRRTREAQSYGEWRWSDFMRIARKFRYCCAYCGDKPDRLDPDHVTPLSRGGLNVIGNLLPVCLRCNSSKRDLLLHEWQAYLAANDRPARATTWAPEDPRYVHLTGLQALAA